MEFALISANLSFFSFFFPQTTTTSCLGLLIIIIKEKVKCPDTLAIPFINKLSQGKLCPKFQYQREPIDVFGHINLVMIEYKIIYF